MADQNGNILLDLQIRGELISSQFWLLHVISKADVIVIPNSHLQVFS